MQISSPFSTLYLLSFDEAKRTESEGKYYFDSNEKKAREIPETINKWQRQQKHFNLISEAESLARNSRKLNE